MSKRLNFAQDLRNRQARYGLSVKDETEWMKDDAAARWLRNRNCALRKGHHPPSAEQPACSGIKRRERPKHRHADLDPCDPHDQLPGVDMRQIPWL